MNLSKKATPSMRRNGAAKTMADRFLKNLDLGKIIDRNQPAYKKSSKKRIAAPAALLKLASPAGLRVEGKET